MTLRMDLYYITKELVLFSTLTTIFFYTSVKYKMGKVIIVKESSSYRSFINLFGLFKINYIIIKLY